GRGGYFGVGVGAMAFVAFEPARSSTGVARNFLVRNRGKPLDHLLTTKSIDSDDVDRFCEVAEAFELGRMSSTASVGKTVALLFFQPSTRTTHGLRSGDGGIRRPFHRHGRHVRLPLQWPVERN